MDVEAWMRRETLPGISATETHIGSGQSQDTGSNALRSLDDTAQSCFAGAGPRKAMTVAGIVDDNNSFGLKMNRTVQV